MAERIFKETFRSPFGKETESDALKVLDSIREAHSEKDGWREIEGYAEKRADGKWYAIRIHEKIA